VVRYQFSPEQVEITSRTTNAVMQWEVFTRGVVFEDGILLYQGTALFNWLPYRCLENAEQREALAGLVREQLGSKVSQR
jgi:hypothetical protein